MFLGFYSDRCRFGGVRVINRYSSGFYFVFGIYGEILGVVFFTSFLVILGFLFYCVYFYLDYCLFVIFYRKVEVWIDLYVLVFVWVWGREG